MTNRAVLMVVALALLNGPLLAQVPADERIPITDPDRLEALGFPRDTQNVFVWSKADSDNRGWKGAAGLETPETWGAAAGHSTVLGYELQPEIDLTKIGKFPGDSFCYENQTNGGPTFAYARIPVPEGARLGQFFFWALDSDPDQDLIFDVYETCLANGANPPMVTLLASAFTILEIGDYFGFTSLNGLTANNRDCGYTVRVKFADSGVACSLDLRVRKLQFSWTRQVSAAPAAATFGDVPTSHPFFQHVEALVKSGTTAGCGGGDFCPDAPITRGQMAAFLAKALGLQWP